MNQDIKPFIIVYENGKVLNLLRTNEKGYKKSIENNQIWAVNPETNRLLPEDICEKIKEFKEKKDWYEAIVELSFDMKENVKNESTSHNADSTDCNIINDLFSVIEQRRKEMPEGSYTTHLFNSGISKIKKKTGEEAVELLLAENRDEIIYEASDLIYHMMVLFSATGIKPEEIFSELRSRE